MDVRDIRGTNISDAWVKAVQAVDQQPGREAFQLAVRISDPTCEVPEIRKIVDTLLKAEKLRPVATVASTIFPVWSARISRNPRELAERYRKNYGTLKKFRSNAQGTYFGRLVEGPEAAPPVDQLNHVINKLRDRKNGAMRAIYEIDTADGEGYDLQVYRHGTDRRKRMGFPCLSSCSFQRDGRLLHLTAFYRNQYLIARAYGNYLGLGNLLSYVAKHTRMRPGQLLVVSGHAVIDASAKAVRSALAQVVDANL